jgi:hypothetical protein
LEPDPGIKEFIIPGSDADPVRFRPRPGRV